MKWTNKGHEFDLVGHLLKGKKNMIIYGSGFLGIELYKHVSSMKSYHKWNVMFLDSDPNKQKMNSQNEVVLAPEDLKEINTDDCFVVVCAFSKQAREEMFSTLSGYGFTVMINAFEHDYFVYNYLSIYFMYELDLVYLSSLNIVPSTLCNLNCNGCLNFNPYIKEHTTYSLEQLKGDCDSLFNAIDLIGRFQITGGEPFLYKNLNELIPYIHNNYAKKIIAFEIVTNGTVMPSDEICEVLFNNNVLVYLDDYRKNVPLAEKMYIKIKEMFDKHKVTYFENCVPEWFDLQPTQPKRNMTDEELVEYFDKCGCPWATVSHNSLSSCNYSLYATKAGIVKFDEDNYFDLTAEQTREWKKQLVEFRLRYNNKGYVELCRQCSGFSKVNNNILEPAVQVKRNNFSTEK